jgi:hypothetical protein
MFFVVVQCSFWLVKKHTPQNMNLEPWNLLPIETCHNLASGSAHISMHGQPKLLKHIPIETCNVSRVIFQPHAPIFHVPHAIPIHAPWPIHEALDLFQFSHASFNFRWTTMSWQLMKRME